MRGRPYAIVTGPRVIYRRGFARRLVAVTALSAVTFGALAYYPVAYAAVPRPYCAGETENGCRLGWANVPTEDGFTEAQCVQYCPRGGNAVPVPVVAAPPPEPIQVEGSCEMVGYSDPNFQGSNFSTNESYPALQEWSKQIASLQVVSGVWDFFSDENFGGDAIRLEPGEYPDLGEQWNYQISSFMCSEPGS